MKKLLLLALGVVLMHTPVLASDFPFGNFTVEEMSLKAYEKDKTANAVVLNEFGKSWISSGDGIPLIHEYHIKIKIFNSKAFDKGNIEIPLYKSDNNSFERVRDIEAVTFYTDDNGGVQRLAFNASNIIRENKNKYWDVVKFAMPGLRDGCIIEYKYTIESPYTLNMKDWTFQTDIPKINSEYEVHIPGFFNFKATLVGPLKLTKNTGDLERECFQVRGSKSDCSKLVFGMADVPAFIEEDHMTSPKNFIAAIDFELNDYVDPYDGTKHVKTQTWTDIDKSLKQSDSFGSQLKKSGVFKDKLPLILTGATDSLSKARAIYAYFQKNVKCNNIYGIWSDNGVRKALDTHSGSVADINLGLVTALNAAGLNTEAVILATRDHGFINKLYPVVGGFNYVVAKVNVNNKTYLLDATEPYLPFGMLPERCLNDQGRVMSLNKPSYWIDMKASQKWARTYAMDLTLQPNGKLTGVIKNFSMGYEALSKRKAIKKFNSIDEYVENLDEKNTKLKILKAEVLNVDSLDLPLSEVYEVEINLFDNMNNNRMAFNPFFLNQISENPFKLAERTYPVDWGAQSDTKVILTMHLPEGYEIENPPKGVSLGLPNSGGRFLTAFDSQSTTFTFSHVIQLNNAIYSSDEYPYLKELFNKIIQEQKSDIIFRKKS
ncbi:DUF3857 and transglutaminase domain-containing protein [uncultured Mucilaginibacter sp.]|uniref:DUF3857 and transglutaminase domain-containing protein n=1 Tax=uncultured Mucilaginibacter sp. TaxID=797541 RepID=UPI0025ED1441|nr:DUF3857 and transglutaminase domain-containing protein [uncultured Mucilaginibacter sp.]